MQQPRGVTLGKDCGSCPEGIVDLAADEVRIGEDGHLVRLTKEAWNALVGKINDGELKAI